MNISAVPSVPSYAMSMSDMAQTNNVARPAIQPTEASASKQSSQDATSDQRKNDVAAEKQRNSKALSEQQLKEVEKLEKRDAQVQRHELAHASVGGQHAGSPSYTYEKGPDGQRYRVGGEVMIDVAPIPNDPQVTIQKMQVVRRAALAPAEPSGADRAIAAEATLKTAEARAELQQQQRNPDAEETNTQQPTIQSKSLESEGGGDSKEASSDSRKQQVANRYAAAQDTAETSFRASA